MPSISAYSLLFRTLEEEKLKTESLLQSQGMIFPKKAWIPPYTVCISQAISSLHHLGRNSIKYTLVLLGFPRFHPGYLRCLVFLHFSFPVQQQLPVTRASAAPGRSRFSVSTALATQSISFHPEHGCKYPGNPHDHTGKYKLLTLRVGFPEDSQGHISRQHAELGSLL